MQILTLLVVLTVSNGSCFEDFAKAYNIAEEYTYPRASRSIGRDIGPLIPMEAHRCDGWLPGDIYPMQVAVRPLYNDSGLPLYDIFEDEWDNPELIGFEFRTWHEIVRTCKLKSKTTWVCWDNHYCKWNGFSIALTEEEKFLYSLTKD